MNFLNGITNLTDWMGNVIMPTLAALFFCARGPPFCARSSPHLHAVGWLLVPHGLGCSAWDREIRSPGCLEQPRPRLDYSPRPHQLAVQRLSAGVCGAATGGGRAPETGLLSVCCFIQ